MRIRIIINEINNFHFSLQEDVSEKHRLGDEINLRGRWRTALRWELIRTAHCKWRGLTALRACWWLLITSLSVIGWSGIVCGIVAIRRKCSVVLIVSHNVGCSHCTKTLNKNWPHYTFFIKSPTFPHSLDILIDLFTTVFSPTYFRGPVMKDVCRIIWIFITRWIHQDTFSQASNRNGNHYLPSIRLVRLD